MKLNNKWIWVWPLSDVHCSDFIEKCEEILLIPTAFQHCTSHQTTLQLTSNSNRFKFGTTWKVPSFGEPTQTCPTQLDHRRRKGKVFPTQRSVRGGGKLFLLLFRKTQALMCSVNYGGHLLRDQGLGGKTLLNCSPPNPPLMGKCPFLHTENKTIVCSRLSPLPPRSRLIVVRKLLPHRCHRVSIMQQHYSRQSTALIGAVTTNRR